MMNFLHNWASNPDYTEIDGVSPSMTLIYGLILFQSSQSSDECTETWSKLLGRRIINTHIFFVWQGAAIVTFWHNCASNSNRTAMDSVSPSIRFIHRYILFQGGSKLSYPRLGANKYTTLYLAVSRLCIKLALLQSKISLRGLKRQNLPS